MKTTTRPTEKFVYAINKWKRASKLSCLTSCEQIDTERYFTTIKNYSKNTILHNNATSREKKLFDIIILSFFGIALTAFFPILFTQLSFPIDLQIEKIVL